MSIKIELYCHKCETPLKTYEGRTKHEEQAWIVHPCQACLKNKEQRDDRFQEAVDALEENVKEAFIEYAHKLTGKETS